VDLLKIDIPAGATRDTPWHLTRLERQAYFRPLKPTRVRLDEEWRLAYEVNREAELTPDSDAALLRQGFVSVTPLTIDITARIKRETLRELLDGASPGQL
jgi:5'-nucleotidase